MAEAMATLTGGAFLIALALKLGASNFQIGILVALPTISPVFQLLGIYLVRKYQNRKLITVFSSALARGPLLLVSILPFLFSPQISLVFLIIFLFFHYLFGSVSGCSWNSWMKDLVPDNMLGRYFSNRSRMIQILSVSLSFLIAFVLDYVKVHNPTWEVKTYSVMFAVGGVLGLLGVLLLAKTPEPEMEAMQSNLFRLFRKPLKDINFRNMIIFNTSWAFAIGLAAPFFSVYLLKMLHLSLSYVVFLNILSQGTNILFIRIWGKFSDQYSNKSILRICAPIYLCCILGWTFTTMPNPHTFTIPLLVLIYTFNGIAVAGINLSMSNIGIKLAPRQGDAAVYLTVRAIIVAAVAGTAPLIGGFFADFFASHELAWNLEWKSHGITTFVLPLLNLKQWDFFFVFSFMFGLLALYRLRFVQETGEANRNVAIGEIVLELRNEVNMHSTFAGLKTMLYFPKAYLVAIKRKKKIKQYIRHKRKRNFYIYRRDKHFSKPGLLRKGS